MDNVRLGSLLLRHGNIMSASLKAESSSRFQSRSGKLSSSFQPKVVMQGGDVTGISFNTFRYAYILNHGVKSQSVKGKLRSYQTRGFTGDQFIERVRDKFQGKIAQDISEMYGKQVVENFRF